MKPPVAPRLADNSLKDAGKAAVERAVYRDFAKRYRTDIDITSIRSGDPHSREPDIVAKSSESDTPVAAELVRLTEEESQALVRRALKEEEAASSISPMSIDAFTRKFGKAQQGLYAGAHTHDLELLAYSDYLVTPWDIVLLACEKWLADKERAQGFSTVWLWSRANFPNDPQESVWLWTPLGGLSRFA